ncbi:TorF family putative porin [Pleionea sp. CnH1-48]|uniref:TorF family putative porin n=1 Tax=Pleionea sp. CnH1-48 TaxID=2954494 RepID=UPI0020969A40|nr:TorF family putative porin [Pleionea sp. CnH1-48]MCO7223264.1 TorF family putative porin [Pleionea sp. CnH1-48]
MKNLTTLLVAPIALSCSTLVQADFSATTKLASDYTFNGVSQTQNDPALQASLDYSGSEGFYAGTWASNVDFGPADGTDLEWDFYAGQFLQLNETVTLDYGIAYYTYHGGDNSSDGNYPEAYTKFGFASEYGTTGVNLWYSWDYFGSSESHTVIMLTHSIELKKGHNLTFTIDRSFYNNSDNRFWDGNNGYQHFRVGYTTQINGFDLEIAAENTSMDLDTADERIVLSVAKTFSL